MNAALSIPSLLMLALGAALSAQDPGAKSTAPLQMRAGAPDASTPLGAAWQDFLQADSDGTWWSRWSPATGTPMEIYGSGLPIADWRGDTVEEGRRCANRLLQQQSKLLALGDCEFRERIGARMGQTWSFVFEQYYHGLPVIGGRADVRVHSVGRIPMFGSVAWQIPNGFSTVPTVGEEAATAIAWQQLGDVSPAKQPGAPRQPRLVIWGDTLSPTLAPVFLAWEIPVSNVDRNGQGPIGRYYVDAHNGAVLHYTSDKHECGFGHEHGNEAAHHGGEGGGEGGEKPAAVPAIASGTVMAWTRTGLAGSSAFVNVPVVGAAVVTTQGTVYTDANGNYSINLNIFIPFATATFTLDGVHCAAVHGASSPVFATTITTGNNGIAQLNASSDAMGAHNTAYYWIYNINEWCRSILGNSAELDTADAVDPEVNIGQTCNAYYTGNTVNFYQAGNGCVNTAFSTVVTHEWGHGLDDRYGGISNNSGDGLSEGWGDIVAMYHTDQPIVGENFYTNGGDIRNGTNTRVYPPPSEVHAAGEVWMGFAWQLRERLAATVGRPNAIYYSNHSVLSSIAANATDQLGAYLQVYVADDNDGNLANLTPHVNEIKYAGDIKHYPYPLSAPPGNDECSGAYTVGNGTYTSQSNDLALNSTPAFSCTGSGSRDVWYKYLAGNGPLTVTTCNHATWDTVIEILRGDCGSLTSVGCNDDSCSSLQSSVTVNVTTPGWYYIRVGGYNNHSGTFDLEINGTQGSYANWTAYGAGCNSYSRAFYELSPAASFDMNLYALTLTRSGSVYNVSHAGSYHVPGAGATALTLFDDSQVTVALTGSFPYPGGTTSNLVVCSNGFVSVGLGNGTSFFPSASAWVASPVTRWGTWHDFNPGAAGSGAVKFEQIGSIAYVTWDGVYDFSGTTPNTWQLQFNLSNGNVTFVWPTMSGAGNNILVGYAPAGPNPDEGSRDITATVPFTTRSTNTFPLSLAAAMPTVNSTVPLVTTSFPGNSTLGAILEGFVQLNPGTSLASYGMPNCFSFIGTPNVTILLFPAGGQATYNQVIPADPQLMGVTIIAQSYAFAPGANPLGVISSNGVSMSIGF